MKKFTLLFVVLSIPVITTGCSTDAIGEFIADPMNIDAPSGDTRRDDIDKVYLLTPGTVPGYNQPTVAIDLSLIHAFPTTEFCLSGQGNEGEDDWWTSCNPMELKGIDRDGDEIADSDVLIGRLWDDQGKSFCVNVRHPSCTNPDAEDANTFQCWADLTGQRADDAVVTMTADEEERDDVSTVQALGITVEEYVDNDGLVQLQPYPDPHACINLP